MDSTNNTTGKKKRRMVSRKTITFCEQREIYVALLHLQDAIEDGDAEKAEGLRRDILKELPIGEDAIEQSHHIYQIEKQQERLRRPIREIIGRRADRRISKLVELSFTWGNLWTSRIAPTGAKNLSPKGKTDCVSTPIAPLADDASIADGMRICCKNEKWRKYEMNEQYQIGDLRLCKACNKAIRFAGKYWEHVPINGAIPRHIGEPWEGEEEKPSAEIKTGYVNFDANDFYALQDKLTAANARIAEITQRCDLCGDPDVACKVVGDVTVCVDCYIDATMMAANARIAELEAQLATSQSNATLFAAITAQQTTATTRLMYVDLTKDNCFEEFDSALGDKQVKAIFCPQYSGNDLYA